MSDKIDDEDNKRVESDPKSKLSKVLNVAAKPEEGMYFGLKFSDLDISITLIFQASHTETQDIKLEEKKSVSGKSDLSATQPSNQKTQLSKKDSILITLDEVENTNEQSIRQTIEDYMVENKMLKIKVNNLEKEIKTKNKSDPKEPQTPTIVPVENEHEKIIGI